jgi:hypothetical protein
MAKTDLAQAHNLQRYEPPPPPDFIKAEKNLLSLGLFTPSSKDLRNVKAKTIGFIRYDGDRKVEASVTIAASAMLGLPDTGDQDKYLALQKLITERRRTLGHIENPLVFTTAEILKILGRAKGGKRYEDVAQFLQRMALTGIVSHHAVYLADRKTHRSEVFHVFDKVISMGESLPDGTVATKNFVWLSEWQLNNINSNHTLPIDMEVYRRLRNHIAKALVPHLQIWLYTSRSEGCFVKRYDQLCQLLGLQPQKHASRIRQQLGPSLDELGQHGYIGSWKLAETRDGRGFKVELYHGTKFHRDLRLRQGERLDDEDAQLTLPVDGIDEGGEEATPDVLAELTRRGVTPKVAQQLLSRVRDSYLVLDQLEWADYLIGKNPDGFYNPAGFYVTVLRDNVPVPSTFETSRLRALRAAGRAESERREARLSELRVAYDQYCSAEVERHIERTYTTEGFARMVEGQKQEFLASKKRDFTRWRAEQFTEYATAHVRRKVSRDVTVPSFQEYLDATRSGGALS